MSVLLNFAIFPTDKGGKGISEYVSKVLKMINESGVSYKLNPMGTTIETENSAITIDVRKDRKDGMQQKIASIEQKVGKIKH